MKKIETKTLLSVIAIGCMSFAGVIVETSMNISFPKLMSEFDVSLAQVQWITTIYLLTVALIVPLSTWLQKNYTSKALFLIANLSFITGLVLDALTPNFALLLVGRIIQGVGTGIAIPLMFNTILEWVDLQYLGVMMGVGTLITAVAPAIGPTYGGLMVNLLGWRYIFVFLFPILLFSLIVGLKNIRQKHVPIKTKIDWLGYGSLACAFVGLILGIGNLQTAGLVSLQAGGALFLGLIALIYFVYRNQASQLRLVELRIFKDVRFSLHAMSFFLVQLISLGMSFILPNYIQIVLGQNATQAGLIVLPGAALGAVFAPISGRILDRYGARKPILSGIGVVSFALVIFALKSLTLTASLIVIAYLLMMFGIGLAYGNIMTSALGFLAEKYKSDGNTVFNTIQQFAGAVGTSIVSIVMAASQNSQHLVSSTALGASHALWLLAILSLIVLVILFRVVPKK